MTRSLIRVEWKLGILPEFSVSAQVVSKVFIFLFALCAALEARGQRYWDVNGSAAGGSSGTNAVGTWGVNNYWSTSANGTSATTGWTSGQQAIFSAGSGVTGTYTVMVSGNQTASGIVFQEGNVTLSGGRLTLTTGVGGATIDVNGGWRGTIDSQIAGSSGLIKAGEGMLVLGGSNTFSGTTDLRSGTLVVANDYALGNSSLRLGGGTISGGQNLSAFMRGPVTLAASSTVGGQSDLTFGGNFNQQGGSWTLNVQNTGRTTFAGPTFTLAENSQSRNLTVNVTGGTMAITGTIRNGTGSGADGLIKSGTGRLELSGNNTFTGPMQVNAGTLALGHNFAAGLGQLVLEDGATVAAFNGPRVIANDLVIKGSVNFIGTDSLTFLDSFKLENDRTFTVENTTIFSGEITGGRVSLYKKGEGTLVLSGDNKFGVPPTVLSVDAGTLAFGHNNGAGRANNVLVLNGGAVQAWDGARTIVNPTVVANNSTISGNHDLTFDGTFGSLVGSRTVTVNNTALTTLSGSVLLNVGFSPATMTLDVAGTSGGMNISGRIENGWSAGSLVKNGAGTLRLFGANTYTGGTTINGGTLLAKNSSGSATGNGMVVINNGGTLAGDGTILGPIVVNNGGAIAPGDGLGTLDTASQTWNQGSMLTLQMRDVDAGAGVGWDYLNITGSLTINGSDNNPVLVSLQSLALNGLPGLVHDFTNSLSYSWRIATATGGITLNGGNAETDFAVLLNNFQNDIGEGRFSLAVAENNRDLMLHFTSGLAVPEPSIAAMASLGFLILIARFRMSSRSSDTTEKLVKAPVRPTRPSRRRTHALDHISGLGLNGFICRC